MKKIFFSILLFIITNSLFSQTTMAKFSPNGEQIVLCRDNLFEIRNLKTNTIVASGKHTAKINSLDFSPNGKQFITGSNDRTIKLWNAKTGVLIKSFETNSCVSCVVFSPSGKYIAAGCLDNSIYLWETENYKRKWTQYLHKKPVTTIAFSNNEIYIFSGSMDNSIKAINIKTGKKTITLDEHTDNINNIKFSPNGKYIISASEDNTIILWNIKNNIITKKTEYNQNAKNLEFDPNNIYFYSAGSDGKIYQWSVNTNKKIKTYNNDNGSGINYLSLSKDGKQIIACYNNNIIKIWNTKTSSCSIIDNVFYKNKYDYQTQNGYKAERKDYALIFYVSLYSNGLSNLEGTKKNAEKLEEVLKNDYNFETHIYANYNAEQIVEVLNIYKKKKYSPNDQLLIYFSGHGTRTETPESCYGSIICANGTQITHKDFTALSANNCGHTLLIIDACFSGLATYMMGNQPPIYKPTRDEYISEMFKNKPCRKALTSGESQTAITDGELSDFSKVLIDALKNEKGRNDVVSYYDLKLKLLTDYPNLKDGRFNKDDNPESSFIFIKN